MLLPHSRVRRAVQLAALSSVCIATVLCGSWLSAAQADDRSSTASRYADVLRGFNAHFSAAQSRDVADHVLLLSSYYSLDPLLLVAIVGIESGWNPDAVSPAGAQGLGQLMPATAEGLSVRAFAAYENLDGTARYLRRLLDKYAHYDQLTRYRLALAGYNAGPAAVERYGGIPPYAQTQTYVVRVIGLWHRLQSTLEGGVQAPTAALAMISPKQTPDPVPAATAAALAPAAVSASPPVVAVTRVPVRAHVPVKVSVHKYTGPISSIALSVPSWVTEGQPIPVTLRVRGSGTLKLIERVGPTVLEKRVVASSVQRIFLKGPRPAGRSRIVTLQAAAPGVRSPETIVVTMPRPTESAFVMP